MSKCPNELGRLPRKEIQRKYYQILDNLENKQDDYYAKQCLQISKDMAEKNQMSLMKIVNTLCNNSNLSELYLNDNNSLTYIKNI